MEDRTFSTNNHPTGGISDTFREYIAELVKEVVLNGEPFDTQKKCLRKNSENEGVDYAALEKNLTDFFEVMEEWKRHGLKSSELMAKMLAKECFISESEMEKLFSIPSKEKNQNILDGHEYVDLGLPSGTLWATCNVGAAKPEEYGNYYAWGETSTKVKYNRTTYKYMEGNSEIVDELTKYCNKSDCGSNDFTDSLIVLQTGDDPAAANWGGDWQTPSLEQWRELLENTINESTTQNGVKGRLFTSKKNGLTLFLPTNYENGSYGCYWSRSLFTHQPHYAWALLFKFGDDYCAMDWDNRSHGCSIRPVLQN